MSFLDLTDLGLVTAAQQLADEAIGYLQAQIPGYTPSPGDLEVIQAEALSLIAADVAQSAQIVPSAIFRAFGTKLYGIPYLAGTPALTQVTFTVADTAGYIIPAGTTVTLAGFPFFTQQPLTIPAGSDSGTVTVLAVATGAAYNGMQTPAELISPVDPVLTVEATGPSYGGVDQEDDNAYQARLVTELRLHAPRPITASDYALMALSFPPAPSTDQQEVGRSAAIDGYSPASTSFTASTHTTTTLTAVSSFTGISAATGDHPGSIITGSGIPANTTVVSVNTGASTLLMSSAATATASGVSLSSVGSYANARNVGVWITDALGLALNSDTLAAVQAWFESYREVNFIVNVLAPTYTTVYASASIHLEPGANQAATQVAVQAAMMGFLAPVFWGTPTVGQAQPSWFNKPWVRINKLIAVVENVRGVDYVPPGGLTIGLAASPVATTDLLLPGPAPLPLSTTASVPLPTIV